MPKHKARPNEAGRERKRVRRPVRGNCPTTGKLRFASKAKAKKELRHYVADHAVRTVYLCPHCGDWHLTKQRRESGKART